MFSASYLNRLALSISTVSITVAGTFSPITISPVAAQSVPCISNPDFNSGTRTLVTSTGALAPITKTKTSFVVLPNKDDRPPTSISIGSQIAAKNAALSFYPGPTSGTSTPDTLFTRYDVDAGVLEFRGKQPVPNQTNGCQLEIDVLPSNAIQEIEQQIRTSNFNQSVPAPVRTRLNQELPNSTIVFIEKSIRPNRVVAPNSSLTGDPVFYEIAVDCTGPNTPYCAAGQGGEAEISANGNDFAFELDQD